MGAKNRRRLSPPHALLAALATAATLAPLGPATALADSAQTTHSVRPAVATNEKPPLRGGRCWRGHCGGGWGGGCWGPRCGPVPFIVNRPVPFPFFHHRPFPFPFHHKFRHHRPPTPTPPTPTGVSSIDTAFQGNTKFVAEIRNGVVQVRDPRTTPAWHSLASVPNYLPNPVGVSLAVQGDFLHVTVRNAAGVVRQASCKVNPTPGTGSNPAWPGNCGAFATLL